MTRGGLRREEYELSKEAIKRNGLSEAYCNDLGRFREADRLMAIPCRRAEFKACGGGVRDDNCGTTVYRTDISRQRCKGRRSLKSSLTGAEGEAERLRTEQRKVADALFTLKNSDYKQDPLWNKKCVFYGVFRKYTSSNTIKSAGNMTP